MGVTEPRGMRQSQAGFLPAYLACLSSIDRRFLGSRFGRFHHRQHAAVPLGNEHGQPRTIRPIALGWFLRQHGRSRGLREPAHGTHRNLHPIMFFQLGGGCGKGLIGPKIRHGALQTIGIAAAFHSRRFAKGANLPPLPTLGEELFFYFDFSQSRVPVELFFSWRFTPGLALYSVSFFCC